MSFEIRSPTYFGSLIVCRFKPKGPWLNSLLSLLVIPSLFLVSCFLQFPVSQEPADSPNVFYDLWLPCISPDIFILSLFFIEWKKKTNCTADLGAVSLQHEGLYKDSMRWSTPHSIHPSSHTLLFLTISLSIVDFSIQAHTERMDYKGIVNWHLNPAFLLKQDRWLIINNGR